MRIGLLDHMGYGNLGDAATQEALMANIRSRIPDAEIVGFSLNPNDTRKRHNIACYSITHWHPGLSEDKTADPGKRKPQFQVKSALKGIPVVSSIIRKILNFGREVAHLARTFRLLRGLDTLIIAGGGQLSDLWRGPWSHPYNVLKFSVLTKLADRKLLFVNVGAGPLKHPLSKVFVKHSVQLADYVSLRDAESQALIQHLGVRRTTQVFPDSVYGLDVSSYRSAAADMRPRPVVGINPIGFCDPRIWPRQDFRVYSRYIDKIAQFALWLLRENYDLRIYSGEASVDLYAIEDLKKRLGGSLSSTEIESLTIPLGENVEDLVTQMSSLDLIVTSKFHGVVFSHLLEKPVVALSYHHKIEDLMQALGHSQYCLSIDTFDVSRLTDALIDARTNAPTLRTMFRESVVWRSSALKSQFDQLFVLAWLQSGSKGWRPGKSGTAVRDSA